MDPHVLEMVLTAYDETRCDAAGQGRSPDIAHREGLTAASMCLAAVTGMQDAAARAEVESINFKEMLAA